MRPHRDLRRRVDDVLRGRPLARPRNSLRADRTAERPQYHLRGPRMARGFGDALCDDEGGLDGWRMNIYGYARRVSGPAPSPLPHILGDGVGLNAKRIAVSDH